MTLDIHIAQVVSMSLDLNVAIEAFSHAGGNHIERLRARCSRTVPESSIQALARRIEQIQTAIFEIVWKKSEQRALTGQEIVEIARQYCLAKEPEINETGLQALLQWIGWMAWHEGCLQQ